MGYDWIIDVLTDMRRFAGQNEMPLLCAQLDEAMRIATVEVGAKRSYAAPWSAEGSADVTAAARKDHQ